MPENKIKKSVVGTQVRKMDDVESTRTITLVASDFSKDRHGTRLSPKGWQLDNFNANPIIAYMHNAYGDSLCLAPNPDDIIGKGRAYVEGEELMIDITFEPADINPTAEKVFRKMLFGSLNACSVGFVGHAGHWGEGEEARGASNETYYFDEQELLEVSIVNIPSNPNALRRSLRESTSSALTYIYRALEGKFRYSELEEMTVRQVLDLVEGRQAQPEEPKVAQEPLDKKPQEKAAEVDEEFKNQITLAEARLLL